MTEPDPTSQDPPATPGMPRADFITGLALIALGVGALMQSLAMPRFADLGVNPYTVPGLVPGLLGAIIAGLGGVLTLRAAGNGGWRMARAETQAPDRAERGREWRRLLITLALTVGYAGGLVGSIPFPLATGLFMLLFILLFTPDEQWKTIPLWRTLVVAVVIAGATATIVTLLFERLFLVRLP